VVTKTEALKAFNRYRTAHRSSYQDAMLVLNYLLESEEPDPAKPVKNSASKVPSTKAREVSWVCNECGSKEFTPSASFL
jgi:hypothetical protein